jgi:hypothetical protein
MQATSIVNVDATVEISVEQLNYGKLAVADSLRIPSSEGFGVTRRSRGLDESQDNALLPLRLMNVRRLECGLIDEKLISRGGLLVRTAPGWDGPSPVPIAMMRARFRPEDGEKGEGRLYQQTATWAVDFETWRRHPAALLGLAGAELQAQPDVVHESAAARFECEPLCWRIVDYGRTPSLEQMALPGVLRMLSMFMAAAGDARHCSMTFGEGGEFEGEAEFLIAAGVALQLLPEAYSRWRDISVVSGLRCDLPGLVIRYLPSPPMGRARVAA